jgi:cellobiose phosphorylase
MYQAAIEAILGLRPQGTTFSVDPCIPTAWSGYSVDWLRKGTRYEITVKNPQHGNRGIASAEIDGLPVNPLAIPLRDDGGTHRIVLVMTGLSAPDEARVPASGVSAPR